MIQQQQNTRSSCMCESIRGFSCTTASADGSDASELIRKYNLMRGTLALVRVEMFHVWTRSNFGCCWKGPTEADPSRTDRRRVLNNILAAEQNLQPHAMPATPQQTAAGRTVRRAESAHGRSALCNQNQCLPLRYTHVCIFVSQIYVA